MENSDSEECISNLTLKGQKIIDCKNTFFLLISLVFAHLNINSIRNTFEELADVLMISETKIDESFRVAIFLIDGFDQP